MRTIFATLLASLAVLCALFVLVSEDRGTQSGSGLIQSERMADVGDRLMQAMLLQRQRGSDYTKALNTIVKAQQALKDEGFYSGPVDGRLSQNMREAIRSFQQSHQLNVTGTIDEDTSRELGIQAG
jgi:peptidoglycan hydrolase-like protein with peptidoglycan-binding domain